ncbi:MAG: glycosyltransferase [Flavisolibacter sp.]
MVLLILTIFLLFIYALLFAYYDKGWRSLQTFIVKEKQLEVFISVIIPARNEAINLPVLLDALKKQSYPSELFEVLVVDDFSEDATPSIVQSFPLPNLRLLKPSVESGLSSKKKAIEAGVFHARGELIVTTDADCLPGTNWLRTLAALYVENDAAFIAAPVKYFSSRAPLQIFQILDFITLQGITAASVHLDFHDMCNGANLAYKKSAFLKVNGFEGIDSVATGDDMLLMHKIRKATPGKVFYLKNDDAIVQTDAMPGWKEFMMQRKRWASKSLVYKDWRIIAVLALVLLVNLMFPAVLVAAFISPVYWWLVPVFLLGKTLIELPIVYKAAKFFRQENYLLYFPFFQPLHIFYTLLTGISSQFGKYEWKGRKTK